MIELGIVGAGNSGKTTLIEALIPRLQAAGYRVATLKHTSHRHSYDTPGKDSARHREAGAVMTVLVGPDEIAVFAESEAARLEQVIRMMAQHCDFCLIEGDRSAERPKLLVTASEPADARETPANVCATCGGHPITAETPHFGTDQLDELTSFIIDNLNGTSGQT